MVLGMYTFTSYIKSVYNSGYRAGITGSSRQQMQAERRTVRRTHWDLGPWWRICRSQRNLDYSGTEGLDNNVDHQ